MQRLQRIRMSSGPDRLRFKLQASSSTLHEAFAATMNDRRPGCRQDQMDCASEAAAARRILQLAACSQSRVASTHAHPSLPVVASPVAQAHCAQTHCALTAGRPVGERGRPPVCAGGSRPAAQAARASIDGTARSSSSFESCPCWSSSAAFLDAFLLIEQSHCRTSTTHCHIR